MSGTDAIRVEGTVTERLNERLVRVELSNGHRLLGHGTMKTQAMLAKLNLGDRVTLEVSPFDLSKGRVKFN